MSKNLRDDIDKDMYVEDFIDYELQAQSKLYKKYFKKNGKNFRFPTLEQAVTTATFGSYTDSSSYANYLESLESQFFNVWDSNVREGYLLGTPTQKIVSKVVGKQAQNAKLAEAGAMQQFKNSVMANTRTALQAMANDTRKLVMQKNEDLIDGYQWVGTLDRRTCLVCGSLDGKEKKKITDFGNQPPIHFNCRCLILPKINGYDELDDDDTRASENGEVSGKITYNDWLKSQPENIQKEVLGVTRFERFQKENDVSEFVNDGKVVPLKTFIYKQREIVYDIDSYDVTPAIDVNDEKYLKEIEKINNEISSKYGINADFTGCEISIANSFKDRLEYYKENYPEALEKIDFIGSSGGAYKQYETMVKSQWNYLFENEEYKNQLIPKEEFDMKPDVLGSNYKFKDVFDEDRRYVVFNEKNFCNKQEIEKIISDSFDKNMLASKNIVSVLDHEFAHVIDSVYGISENEVIINIFNEYSNKENLEQYLSYYGFKSVKEMVAESFSEVENSVEPRQFAVAIVDFIKGVAKK